MKLSLKHLTLWFVVISLCGCAEQRDELPLPNKPLDSAASQPPEPNADVPQTNDGSVYYIAMTGDDRNEGTLDSPWKTLQHAADRVEPGSTVYIREGVYRQKLHITRGGSATEDEIVFSGYPQEAAILDGEGLEVDGIEGLVEIENASYVTIRQLELRNYKTSASGEVPVGIYVHGAGKGIRLLENRIHDIANMSAPEGQELSGRDAHGIAVYGTEANESLRDLTIDNNELYDLVLGSSESLAVNGNVDTFAITNNIIHDNDNIGIDLIGFEGTAGRDDVDQARNGTVKGNSVYRISTDQNPSYGRKLPNGSHSAGGIYVDGGRNNLIEQNRVFDNDIGIELASEHAGRMTSGNTVRDNLIYRNRLTGIAMGGYDEDRGGTSENTIVYNTLYDNDLLGDGNGQLFLQAYLTGNKITDNILVAGDTGVLIYNEYASNKDNRVDRNAYFSVSGAENSTWIWKSNEYTGFVRYKEESGNDADSSFANPMFMDAAKGDFRLKPGSPAEGKGWREAEPPDKAN